MSFNGEAIEEGAITFLPTPGTPGSNVGATITHGRYTIAQAGGLAAGRYRVEIDGFRKTGRKVRDLAGPDRRLAAPPMIEERESIIPAQFNVQSILEVNVDDSTAELNFPLTSKRPR